MDDSLPARLFLKLSPLKYFRIRLSSSMHILRSYVDTKYTDFKESTCPASKQLVRAIEREVFPSPV